MGVMKNDPPFFPAPDRPQKLKTALAFQDLFFFHFALFSHFHPVISSLFFCNTGAHIYNDGGGEEVSCKWGIREGRMGYFSAGGS